MTTTTVSGAPYVVTIQETGGFPWESILRVVSTLGTLAAIGVSVWIALRSLKASRQAADLQLRRETAIRVIEWSSQFQFDMTALTYALESAQLENARQKDEALGNQLSAIARMLIEASVVFDSREVQEAINDLAGTGMVERQRLLGHIQGRAERAEGPPLSQVTSNARTVVADAQDALEKVLKRHVRTAS